MQMVSGEYLPLTEAATRIERELLNARINFIYFVTIQKPGSLEKGRERFRNAEQEMPKLREFVANAPDLAELRPEMDKLSKDFEAYKPALENIIQTVQQHRNHGPEFDAMLKDWAARGTAMVDSAGHLGAQGSRSTGSSASETMSQLRMSRALLMGCGAAGMILGVLIALFATRSISKALRLVIHELSDSAHQVAEAAGQIASSSQSHKPRRWRKRRRPPRKSMPWRRKTRTIPIRQPRT
jgi:hypothetical protein